MAEVEPRDHLGKHFPNEVFLDVLSSGQAPFDDLTKVSTFAVLHDDEDFEVSLVDASIVKAHNIGVL